MLKLLTGEEAAARRRTWVSVTNGMLRGCRWRVMRQVNNGTKKTVGFAFVMWPDADRRIRRRRERDHYAAT